MRTKASMTNVSAPTRGLLAVDNQSLVVGSPADLPMRCVRTNLPLTANRMRSSRLRFVKDQSHYAYGPMIIVWVLIISWIERYVLPHFVELESKKSELVISTICWLPFIFWLAYGARLTAKSACQLKYGVHPSVFRRANLWIMTAVITLTIVSSGSTAVLSTSMNLNLQSIVAIPQTIVIFLVCAALGLIVKTVFFQVRLKVHRHCDGKYWITGCAPVFLESLQLPKETAEFPIEEVSAKVDEAAYLARSGRIVVTVGGLAIFGPIFWVCATMNATTLLLLSILFFIAMSLGVGLIFGTRGRDGAHLSTKGSPQAGFMIRLFFLIAIEAAIALMLSPWLRR